MRQREGAAKGHAALQRAHLGRVDEPLPRCSGGKGPRQHLGVKHAAVGALHEVAAGLGALLLPRFEELLGAPCRPRHGGQVARGDHKRLLRVKDSRFWHGRGHSRIKGLGRRPLLADHAALGHLAIRQPLFGIVGRLRLKLLKTAKQVRLARGLGARLFRFGLAAGVAAG